MSDLFAPELSLAIAGSGVLGAVGAAITTSEDLRRFPQFDDEGLLSWQVTQLSAPWMARGVVGRGLDAVLAYPRFRAVLVTRLLACVATVVGLLGGVRPVAALGLVVLATSTVLLSIRNPFGVDGSHQLAVLLFASLAVATIVGPDTLAARLAVWFVVIQACLSYLVAGYYKLISPAWRSGLALPGILSTRQYGNEQAHRLVSERRWVARLGCWAVIVFELAFPLVLLGDPTLVVALLLAGVSFHAGTAVVMSLNVFFWMFVATYPLVLWAAASGPLAG